MMIQEVLNRAMTVGELREALAKFDTDAPVVVKVGYGDRGNTQQALIVREVDRLLHDEYLRETSYSTSGVCIDQLDDEDEAEERDEKLSSRPSVVVIDIE